MPREYPKNINDDHVHLIYLMIQETILVSGSCGKLSLCGLCVLVVGNIDHTRYGTWCVGILIICT